MARDKKRPGTRAARAPKAPGPIAEPRDAAPWISIAALPLDLQLAVLQSDGPVNGIPSRRPWEAPSSLKIAAGLTLGIGLITALTSPEVTGFGSIWRAGGLIGGALLVAVVLAWRSARGFRAEGGQKLVIGPASLIIADARSARILPAEELTVDWNTIQHGSESICKIAFDPPWREQLERVVKKAAASEATRDGDRFRKAAARARPMSRLEVAWTHREPQIVAVGLALSAGLFLEAGPLHARGVAMHATGAATTALVRLGDQVDTGRERTVVTVSKALTATIARKERERLLGDALGKTDLEARLFLAKYGGDKDNDEARPRVQGRLRELCQKARPERPGRGDAAWTRLLRAVVRGTCETPGRTLYFSMTGEEDAEVARTFLKNVVSDAAALSSDPVASVEPAPAGATSFVEQSVPMRYPYVRLAMRRLGAEQRTPYDRTQRWAIDVTPVDALEQAVPGAEYHHQLTIKRPR